jgi:hypothetical protein
MKPAMSIRSWLAIAIVIAGCGGDETDAVKSYDFGPYEVAATEEISDKCVQITLHNTEPVYVNSVELTTGPGFHHSNWLFVPEHVFAGEDGTFVCDDRGYSEAVAAVFGGVLFAQSTQAPHEIQQFPEGVAVKLPTKTKIVAQIHLLNPGEETLTLRPNIKLGTIPEATTVLSGISFQNQALGLPPNKASRFTVECDLAPDHNMIFGTDPNFKIYYALAHYHEKATKLNVEAVKPDGSSAIIFTTEARVGDSLGGMIDPTFDMTGYTKLRFYCDFYNPTSQIVRWGIGDQEMCVFLAFSDSTYAWGGGVNTREEPTNPVEVGNATHYTNGCQVFATDASR